MSSELLHMMAQARANRAAMEVPMVYTAMDIARHEHGALTPLIAHKEVGTARTWRLHCGGATAGEEAYLTLDVGQVRSTKPHRLVIQAVPMHDRAMAAPQEERTLRRLLKTWTSGRGARPPESKRTNSMSTARP